MVAEIKRYLGIDWGEVRIGLSLGDNLTKISSPLGVVANIGEIIDVIKKEDVEMIVLGEPIKMSGEKASEEWQNFYSELKEKVAIQVVLSDERLSSQAADKLHGNTKTKAARDAIAAQLILQSYFDKH